MIIYGMINEGTISAMTDMLLLTINFLITPTDTKCLEVSIRKPL